MDLSTLQPGQVLFSYSMAVEPEACAAYREATQDGCEAEGNVVPPMAIAALVMSEAMRALELPAGAVHTGQEVEFLNPVPEDVPVECSSSVVQNSVRRGVRFLTLELQASCAGVPTVSGRASIAVPVEGEDA